MAQVEALGSFSSAGKKEKKFLNLEPGAKDINTAKRSLNDYFREPLSASLRASATFAHSQGCGALSLIPLLG
jgi:hypothetical protein